MTMMMPVMFMQLLFLYEMIYLIYYSEKRERERHPLKYTRYCLIRQIDSQPTYLRVKDSCVFCLPFLISVWDRCQLGNNITNSDSKTEKSCDACWLLEGKERWKEDISSVLSNGKVSFFSLRKLSDTLTIYDCFWWEKVDWCNTRKTHINLQEREGR